MFCRKHCARASVFPRAAKLPRKRRAQPPFPPPPKSPPVSLFLPPPRTLAKAGPRVELLTSGPKAAEKPAVIERTRPGKPPLVTGPLPLIEDTFAFPRLG